MIELDPKAMHPTQKRKNKREGRGERELHFFISSSKSVQLNGFYNSWKGNTL